MPFLERGGAKISRLRDSEWGALFREDFSQAKQYLKYDVSKAVFLEVQSNEEIFSGHGQSVGDIMETSLKQRSRSSAICCGT